MAMPGAGTRSSDAARREASEWVALIHDPEAAVDRAAFERWRATDPRNGPAYARAERAWETAALLGQTSFGRARSLPERQRFFDRPQVRYAFAAAAVLVVAIVSLSSNGGRMFGFDRPPETAQVASRIGQIRQVKLADGSIVTLDTDSVLRVALSKGERRLALERGRVRFNVAHDAARPFVVMAGGGSVTARGTIFDVSVVGGDVQVALLRGAVEVRTHVTATPGSTPRAAAQLRPGQQVSFAPATILSPVRSVAATESQWTRGMLTFDHTRLADAVADANRYSAAKIALADSGLNDLRLTGAYQIGDAQGLATSMAASLGLNAVRTPRGDLVIVAPSPRRLK